MSTWRPFDDYSPLAQRIVAYLWEQRPPLNPSQFATAIGVSRQTINRILNHDTVPEPPVLYRIARQLSAPLQEIYLLVGYSTPDDPILTRSDAWADLLKQIEQAALDDAHKQMVLSTLRSFQTPMSLPDGQDARGTDLV